MASVSLELTAKMKGLPFKASVDDVIKFFGQMSLRPECIYLKRHPDGRPSGEAFVRFEGSEDQKAALLKDRETFGPNFGERYVRVYPVLETDVNEIQQAMTQHSSQGQGCGQGHTQTDSVLKIKSLPFDASQLDVIHFFNGYKLKPNGVQLVVRSDNKFIGEAFVDFESPDEAIRALRERDHKTFGDKFGDRYVRLIQVSRKEMQATLALRFGGEGILKMKGIPFKAVADDVRKFFGAYKIKQDGISFIMHGDGRPTGMAFIEFDSPQEAVRAMEMDRAKFGPEYGDRFCMLQLVGRHEMDKVQLQKEGSSNSGNNDMLNKFTALQAAALATQAALQNPALQPLLMGHSSNSWLNSAALQLGLLNPASAAAFASAGLGHLVSLPQSSHTALPTPSTMGFSAASLAQLASSLPIDPATVAAAASAAASVDPLLYSSLYPSHSLPQTSQTSDWLMADNRALSSGFGWAEQLAMAASGRQQRSQYTSNGQSAGM